MPVDWFAEQLHFMLSGENEKPVPGLLNRCPRRVWIRWLFFQKRTLACTGDVAKTIIGVGVLPVLGRRDRATKGSMRLMQEER
jgi:hypothetical protein